MTKQARYLLIVQGRHSGINGMTRWQRHHAGVACPGPSGPNG